WLQIPPGTRPTSLHSVGSCTQHERVSKVLPLWDLLYAVVVAQAVSLRSLRSRKSRKLTVCVTHSNSNPAHQIREPRIGAQIVHERFNLQIGNFPGALLETTLQPVKCPVLIFESDVNYGKSVSGHVTFSGNLVHLPERFHRFLFFTQCSLSECK